MVVSQARIDRLRREADTILTRTDTAEEALSRARQRAATLQSELDARREAAGDLAVFPLDPVAVLVFARFATDGAATSRTVAGAVDADHDRVRTLYAAMDAVGLVEPYEGSIIKGSERKLSPKSETHKKHTSFVTTTVPTGSCVTGGETSLSCATPGECYRSNSLPSPANITNVLMTFH